MDYRMTSETFRKGVNRSVHVTGLLRLQAVKFNRHGLTGRIISDKIPINALSEERRSKILSDLKREEEIEMEIKMINGFGTKSFLWAMYQGQKQLDGKPSTLTISNTYFGVFPPQSWVKSKAELERKGDVVEIRATELDGTITVA